MYVEYSALQCKTPEETEYDEFYRFIPSTFIPGDRILQPIIQICTEHLQETHGGVLREKKFQCILIKNGKIYYPYEIE